MKKILLILVFLVLIIEVFAITAAIGTARGIVRIDVEEGKTVTLDRTLKVMNRNDVDVNVGLEVSGDLIGRLDLMETEFVMSPNEEKNVRYLVRINQPGRYVGKIKVGFARADGEEAGVGTMYTLIIIAEGEGEEFVSENQDLGNQDNLDDETGDDTEITGDVVDTPDDEDGVSVSFGNTKPPVKKQMNVDVFALVFILLLLSIIVLGGFLYLRKTLK